MILGRQPAIGLAELESLLGAAHIRPLSEEAAVCDLAPQDLPFARLGGTVKLAAHLGNAPAKDWRTMQAALSDAALACAEDISEGKIQLGLSLYGARTSARQLLAAGLEIKKRLRERGYSVRLSPNQEPALSSAQVLHNHLVGERGIELVAVQDGAQVTLARTVAVQDINAYAARDQGRPKRDAFVGMLPPKLAQTIVNLAAAGAQATHGTVALDPFCGTGVVLQEANLMGFDIYGSDIEPRMVAFASENLEWLATERGQTRPQATGGEYHRLEIGDATAHHWQPAPAFVASETYLGQPLGSWPAPEKLQVIIATCDTIIGKFLRNIGPQLANGTRLCLAVPAWRAPNGTLHHLPLLDHLGQMGYNRISFEHARTRDLVYYRPDQLVARELLVITRN